MKNNSNEMTEGHHTGGNGNDKIRACQDFEFSTICNYCGIIYLPSNIPVEELAYCINYGNKS